jgi:hypothetical protein
MTFARTAVLLEALKLRRASLSLREGFTALFGGHQRFARLWRATKAQAKRAPLPGVHANEQQSHPCALQVPGPVEW